MQQLSTKGADAAGALARLIGNELRSAGYSGANAVAAALREQYGDSIAAILFYGSCLRTGSDDGGILDLYVLVDRYRDFYPGRGLALLNALLPPNVFYLETPDGDRTVRAKYAVISVAGFSRRTSMRCFSSSFWARFAQPCALLYARDAEAETAVANALANAVGTFVQRALPLMPDKFEALELWKQGLSASYRTELRPEGPGKAAELVAVNAERYREVTRLALGASGHCLATEESGDGLQIRCALSSRNRKRGRLAWAVRRVQGKLLNFLRLMKASLTFDGGVDYLLWKIERHSGVREEVSPLTRRYPLLGFWATAWRLYRRGAFR